jgi:hypothetical protein
MPKDYKARPEQTILFKIKAWDSNCPQHIPLKFDAADVAAAIAARDARIAELEAEVAAEAEARKLKFVIASEAKQSTLKSMDCFVAALSQ